jgi:hypothetical protein
MSEMDHSSAVPRPHEVFGRFEGIINQTEPAIIDEQIAYGQAIEAQGGAFFNNFGYNLPGGLYRTLVEQLGRLDSPLASADDFNQSSPLSLSERACTVSWRDFFADIDQALAENGLELTELRRLSAVVSKAPLADKQTAQISLMQYVLPVYRQLRLLGYSHGDLYR